MVRERKVTASSRIRHICEVVLLPSLAYYILTKPKPTLADILRNR